MQRIYSEAVNEVKNIMASKGYTYISEDAVWRDRDSKSIMWTPFEGAGGKNIFLYYIYYQNKNIICYNL